MPYSFIQGSRLIKGALAIYRSSGSGERPDIIEFQFNPDELSRSLRHQEQNTGDQSQGKAREEAQRRKGPPTETIDLTVALDAMDQTGLIGGDSYSGEDGLHPVLAAFEMLLYPKASEELLSYQSSEGDEGVVEFAYAEEEVPQVLFIWGRQRVLPVQLTSFSVTEQAFDNNLNPMRAAVDLSLRVLSYADMDWKVGRQAYAATHSRKQRMASQFFEQNSGQTAGIPGSGI